MRLRDDHFSAQHSRYLTDNELKEIYYILKRSYGIDKPEIIQSIDYNEGVY